MARYIIPKPITQKYELFPGSGWGLMEAGLVAGSLAGALALVFLFSLIGEVVPGLILGVFGGFIGSALAVPMPGQPPLYQLLQAFREFRRQPRRWLYDWTASDWEDFTE